jgi:putative DNA primase/helicase
MLSAKNGTRLRALWRGEISAYRCHREAEAALLASLRWWCQGDANQVDRIFRQSGLIVETIGLRR